MADIPQSRTEEILYATINGEEYTGLPESRIEELLLELKEVIEAGGGGGGGTSTIAWKPTVAADGTISWVRTASETKPDDQNIKGPKGENGSDGDPGLGIKLVSINQNGHLIITYDDDTTQDAGAIPGSNIATESTVGLVKPDGETMSVDANGVLSVIEQLPDPPVINLEGIASENDVNTKSATFTAANDATYLLIEVIAGDTFPVITSSSATVNGDDVNLKEYYADSAHINSKYTILSLKAGDVVEASVRSSIAAYGTSVSIMLIKLSSPIQNLVLKASDARTSGECAVDFNTDKDGFYLLFFLDRREGSIDFNTIKLNDKTITQNRIICSVSDGWEVRQGMCIASAKVLDNFEVSIQVRGYADAVGIFYVETGSDSISYSDLTDKPQINGVTLSGNKTAADLGLAVTSIVAPEFDETVTYVAGKYVIYNGQLYRCLQYYSGAWNPSYFSLVDVSNELFNAVSFNKFWGSANLEYTTDYEIDHGYVSQDSTNVPPYPSDGKSGTTNRFGILKTLKMESNGYIFQSLIMSYEGEPDSGNPTIKTKFYYRSAIRINGTYVWGNWYETTGTEIV